MIASRCPKGVDYYGRTSTAVFDRPHHRNDLWDNGEQEGWLGAFVGQCFYWLRDINCLMRAYLRCSERLNVETVYRRATIPSLLVIPRSVIRCDQVGTFDNW